MYGTGCYNILKKWGKAKQPVECSWKLQAFSSLSSNTHCSTIVRLVVAFYSMAWDSDILTGDWQHGVATKSWLLPFVNSQVPPLYFLNLSLVLFFIASPALDPLLPGFLFCKNKNKHSVPLIYSTASNYQVSCMTINKSKVHFRDRDNS